MDAARHLRHQEAGPGKKGREGEIVEGLGQEAVLFNNAELAISIDDENAVSLSILLLVFDGELPVTNEEIAAALTQLGSKLVERL